MICKGQRDATECPDRAGKSEDEETVVVQEELFGKYACELIFFSFFIVVNGMRVVLYRHCQAEIAYVQIYT